MIGLPGVLFMSRGLRCAPSCTESIVGASLAGFGGVAGLLFGASLGLRAVGLGQFGRGSFWSSMAGAGVGVLIPAVLFAVAAGAGPSPGVVSVPLTVFGSVALIVAPSIGGAIGYNVSHEWAMSELRRDTQLRGLAPRTSASIPWSIHATTVASSINGSVTGATLDAVGQF